MILAQSAAQTFTHFGAEHFIVLGVFAFLVSAACLALRLAPPTARPRLTDVICAATGLLLLGSFAFGQYHRIAYGYWALHESLPLHLCDLATFAAGISLLRWRRPTSSPARAGAGGEAGGRPGRVNIDQRLYELAYFWGLGGTVQALITPDVVGCFPDVTCIRFFLVHGAIVGGVMILAIGVGLRPLPGAVRRCWVVTFSSMWVVAGINALLRAFGVHANYMYLCQHPAAETLFKYFGPWPWYVATLVGVATVVFCLLAAPYAVLDFARRRRRKRMADRNQNPDRQGEGNSPIQNPDRQGVGDSRAQNPDRKEGARGELPASNSQ